MNDELIKVREMIAAVERRINRPIRILVIDDDDDCYELFTRVLAGCDCERATSGEEALKMLARDPERFDCVVSDERLPGLRGHEVIKEIRARWPQVFTVLSTSFEYDSDTREEIAKLSPLMTLSKPPQPEAVEKLLNFILERRRA